MTWAITRLQEALIDEMSSDATLVTLTGDGVETNAGVIHHIGQLLKESAMKGRLPYLAVSIPETEPLLQAGGHLQMFKSEVEFISFSKDECVATTIGDRVQALVTASSIEDCNRGFFDFTNSHVKVYSTEFAGRSPEEYDKVNEFYVDMVMVTLVWSPIPCDGEIVDPACAPCANPGPDDYECEDE